MSSLLRLFAACAALATAPALAQNLIQNGSFESPALGVGFRSFIFEHQHDIRPDNLRQFGEQFAAQHQLTLPPDVDPDGKLQALVQADFDLGMRIKLEYVPLIFVIRRDGEASRAVEVTDLAKLGEAVAQLKRD